MSWLDRISGWTKNQVDEFGRTYGAYNDARLAAEGQARSSIFNALPERLKVTARLAAAPKKAESDLKLRGPIAPEPAPSVRPKGDPYFTARPEDFAGNDAWLFPAETYTDWNRKDAPTADGRFGLGFRQDGGRPKWHHGVDITMPVGTPVRADRDGVALRVGQQTGYGLTIEAGPDEFGRSRYAHLSEVYVKPGQRVKKGEVIGLSGVSGNTPKGGKPHLHYEVYRNNERIDPYHLFVEGEASAGYRK
ncbi:MAG: M23 family metallopeptidase [Phenylobacterium sp.]